MTETCVRAFAPIAVAANGSATVADALPHSDGGLSDNFGAMPLLARQVENVLVFFNTNTPFVQPNDDIKSLFMPVGTPDGGGDKTANVVFDAAEGHRWSSECWRAAPTASRRSARRISKYRGTRTTTIAPYTVNLCVFDNADATGTRDRGHIC
jgi:hypothetical protein